MTAKKDTISFYGADMFVKAITNRGKIMRVFDWDKAALLMKEKNAVNAEAGLAGDWPYTSGKILVDGKPTKGYAYLASTWAVPTLIVDDEEVACWIYETETDWDSGTSWPQSALDIYEGKND
jgi:hypothetical protein